MSSILVAIKSAYATSYQLLTVTLVVSRTVFEKMTHKARKQVLFLFLPHPCLTPLLV